MSEQQKSPTIPTIQCIIAVLWPSFLVSGIATVLFFTAFDPVELFQLENTSRIGLYSMGFFFFWLMSATSSLLTIYFQIPCQISDPD